MTSIGAGFLPLERQLFPRALGEALAELVRRRWPRDTAKHLARAWALDPATAANVVKGHVSERTITKAIAAEGWALLAPLGEALIGHAYHAHLQRMIDEHDQTVRRLSDHKARVASLRRRAAQLGLVDAGIDDGADGVSALEGGS